MELNQIIQNGITQAVFRTIIGRPIVVHDRLAYFRSILASRGSASL